MQDDTFTTLQVGHTALRTKSLHNFDCSSGSRTTKIRHYLQRKKRLLAQQRLASRFRPHHFQSNVCSSLSYTDSQRLLPACRTYDQLLTIGCKLEVFPNYSSSTAQCAVLVINSTLSWSAHSVQIIALVSPETGFQALSHRTLVCTIFT